MSPIVLQHNGIKDDLEATSSLGKMLPQSSWSYVAVTGREETLSGEPVEYEGESIVFNPEYMHIDVPYPFSFLEHCLLAVKRSDRSVDFYYLPRQTLHEGH